MYKNQAIKPGFFMLFSLICFHLIFWLAKIRLTEGRRRAGQATQAYLCI